MAKKHSFFFTVHNSVKGLKEKVNTFIRKQDPIWFCIGEEPYLDKAGSHIHLMMRFKNPREPKAVRKVMLEAFNKKDCDLFMEPIQGRFKDQVNYLTNEYAGEHKDNPKKLDEQPIFYPSINFDDSTPVKEKVSDKVVAAIVKGCSYDWLVRTYPNYMLQNGAKVRRFMSEAKLAFKGTQQIPNPDGSPRPPYVKPPEETPSFDFSSFYLPHPCEPR